MQGNTTTLTLPVYWVMRSVYQSPKVTGEGVSLYHFSGQIVAQVGSWEKQAAADWVGVELSCCWCACNSYTFMPHITTWPRRSSSTQTTFGCPSDCGPNGRCTATPDGAAACACECGWAGAACDVPSGFCSSFPAELSGAAVCPVSPNPAPAPTPEPAPCRPLQGGWASGGLATCDSVCGCGAATAACRFARLRLVVLGACT